MFGFQATNELGSLTISDNFPNLVFQERGQIIVRNTSVTDRPAYGVSYFNQPVTQQSPPNIFIRFNSGNHETCNIYMSMLGSPGNWIGFAVWAGAIGGTTLPRHVLDYVLCKFTDSKPATGFGMVVYDSQGNQTYKSEDKSVKFSKFTKSWFRNDNGGEFVNIFPLGITIENDDYIDISSMNRGNVHMSLQRTQFTSVRILSGGVRTLALVSQNTVSLGIGGPKQLASTNFCIPICKFPIEIYS